MCGEMAGEPFYIPILLGLGIDELSMNVMALPRVKRVLRSLDFKQSQVVIDNIFKLSTAGEIEMLLKKEVKKYSSGLFR
jgi:phosphotransferase system enzyme I (PtsI)